MKVNEEYIRHLIKCHGLTQNQFAIKVGVSKATISRILNGKRGAGGEFIGGIIKAFPKSKLEDLFKL